jgi:hypothetical protein
MAQQRCPNLSSVSLFTILKEGLHANENGCLGPPRALVKEIGSLACAVPGAIFAAATAVCGRHDRPRGGGRQPRRGRRVPGLRLLRSPERRPPSVPVRRLPRVACCVCLRVACCVRP